MDEALTCKPRKPIRFIALFGLLVLVFWSGAASAQTFFERLVMPGDLIAGHAKLEPNCSNCHAPFSKNQQRTLCLDCHKEISRDIDAGAGFHGRRPEIKVQECNHCHTDHVGRDADIVRLDRETFDHDFTDFALDGAHVGLACVSCHEDGKKFAAAPGECAGCHEEDEPHMGRLGRDCASCHKTAAWNDLKPFDHSGTGFALDGAHRDIACASCHLGEVYKGLPSTCADCHRIQDVHQGRFGLRCETCHAVTKWTEVRFNHDTDTRFMLRGKHAEAKCEACHTANLYGQKLATDCYSCHRDDDPHDGQLGEACDSCHSPEDWLKEVVFDHDITRFPLIGLHAVVPCEGCHQSAAYRDAPTGCVDCHEADDFHEGRLGKTCSTCHNPNGWERWVFDHDTQTRFALTGAHFGLECKACHSDARSADLKIPGACISCHARDDTHRGQFGSQCQTCHTTKSFRNARLRN